MLEIEYPEQSLEDMVGGPKGIDAHETPLRVVDVDVDPDEDPEDDSEDVDFEEVPADVEAQ